MEKLLSYFPVIPLKEMALRRIAVVIVNRPDVLAKAGKFSLDFANEYYYERKWLEIVSSKITDAASKLLLPASLTSEIKPILKAVCTGLLKWEVYHEQFVSNFYGDFSVIVAENLCWTTAGTVDYRKTSEMLVRSAVLDGVQRFELACFYCLEDYTPILWQELSEEDKRTFYSNNEIPLEVDAPNLQFLLPYILKKHPSTENDTLADVRRDPLKYAAECGNRAATEYCLGKLPKVSRESTLFRTAQSVLVVQDCYAPTWRAAKAEQLPDVLRYLLSLMTPEEQLRFFKESPCKVLQCFLAWPSHDLFLDIADVIWTFLPEDEYRSLLYRIGHRMYRSGYYLPNIVQEFFLRSPRSFRKGFADNWYIFYILFSDAEDSKTIRVVSRSLDHADRVKLICCESALRLFDGCLLWEGGRWDLVEGWIRGASLSNEDRERLREAFAEFVHRTDRGYDPVGKAQKRKRFFELLDEMDASAGSKRSAEDEAATRVKKVCKDGNDTLSRN